MTASRTLPPPWKNDPAEVLQAERGAAAALGEGCEADAGCGRLANALVRDQGSRVAVLACRFHHHEARKTLMPTTAIIKTFTLE